MSNKCFGMYKTGELKANACTTPSFYLRIPQSCSNKTPRLATMPRGFHAETKIYPDIINVKMPTTVISKINYIQALVI